MTIWFLFHSTGSEKVWKRSNAKNRTAYGMEHHIVNLGELAYAQCTCMLSTWKISDCMYSHPMQGALDLCNKAVSEKIIARWVRGHIFTLNRSPRGEMWFNGQTHTQYRHIDVATTVTLAACVHCRLTRVSGWHQNRMWIVCGCTPT